MNKKILIILLTLTFLFTQVSATDHLKIDNPETVTYNGEYKDLKVECTASDCPTGSSVKLEMCDARYDVQISSAASDKTVYEALSSNIEIPQDSPCGYGDHRLEIIDSDNNYYGTTSNKFRVEDKDMNNPHRGLTLGLVRNRDKDIMRNLFLSDYCVVGGGCRDNINDGEDYAGMYILETDQDLADGGDVDELKGPASLSEPITVNEKLEPAWNTDSSCFNEHPSSSDACDLLEEQFSTVGSKKYEKPTRGLDFTSFSPIHENGEFRPEGEIMIGYEPNYYVGNTKKGGTGPFVYICREGANTKDTSTGQVVNSSQASDANIYKCDTENGDWNEVTQCSDGLDNDGDSYIDTQDPNCDSSSDTSESEGIACVPVVGIDSNGDKAAFYGSGTQYSPQGIDCSYANKEDTPTYTSTSPNQLTCNKDGSVDDSPDNRVDALSSDPENYCSDFPSFFFDGHGDSMPMVEYFVPEKAMPTAGNNYEEAQRFADSTGYKNKFYQVLHEAESDYADASSSSEYHDKSSYEPLNMEDLGDGYNQGEYIQSWNIANASVENGKVNGEGLMVDDSTFQGGFAGKCSSGNDRQWEYDGSKWLCTTGTASPDTIEANVYILNNEVPERYAGVQVNLSEVSKWEDSTRVNPFGSNNADKMQIRAQCWWGGSREAPPMNERVNLTQKVNSFQDTRVVGKIPDRSTTPDNENVYTCTFGFRQKVDSRNAANLPSNLKIWDGGSEVTANDQAGWITEGTNRNGVIDVDVKSIEVPSGSTDSQTWLNNHESNSAGKLWPNFKIDPDPCLSRNPLIARGC